jgi:UDP-N-acetylglucosamine transferase subunit ALG13
VIFATVGSQEPFDRLIRSVDEWGRLHPRSDIFAQIGASDFRPKFVDFTKFLEPAEFNRVMRAAKVIVAHAGMGSIISALELGKPIVVMPRKGALRETRNDHQVATAKRFGAQGRVVVAQDERDFPGKLDYALNLPETEHIDPEASPRLIATIRAFLDNDLSELDPAISLGRFESPAAKSAALSLASFRTRKA